MKKGIKNGYHGDETFNYTNFGSENKSLPVKRKVSATPILDEFSIDITAQARAGSLDPVIGRTEEIEGLMKTLIRRTKSNPILIGEPGVGKTAIIEALAQKISENDVPDELRDKEIRELDVSKIVAGTKYRGEFEERLSTIMSESEEAGNIIVYIDEIHMIVGSGGAAGSSDAASIIKKSLTSGHFQCIGCTTLDDYRKHIEKDKALTRRFQKILIDQPSAKESIKILKNIRYKYEEHHSVKFPEDVIEHCVTLSDRYITDRYFPDKAIDVMDETAAFMKIKKKPSAILKKMYINLEKIIEKKKRMAQLTDFESAGKAKAQQELLESEITREAKRAKKEDIIIISKDNVSAVFSKMTKIPVGEISGDEKRSILNLEKKLKEKVVGQDEAIKVVSKAIRRNRSGLKNPDRPIGTFMFIGATGVGKTLLAKVLAKEVFHLKENFIRIDMSEYMEKHSTSRLVGAPPGYVGYEEGGQLTEQVRRRPYSLILLDEIEKAHPKVFNILLQMLEDGRMTDGLGREIDFRNTIVIMTSNIGSREIQESGNVIGYGRDDKNQKSKEEGIMFKSLQDKFAPEFLNRIDEIVKFNPLEEEILVGIVDIEISELSKRISNLNYSMEVKNNVKLHIAAKSFSPKYGARQIRREIVKKIEDPISEIITEGSSCSKILVSLSNDGEIVCKVNCEKSKS